MAVSILSTACPAGTLLIKEISLPAASNCARSPVVTHDFTLFPGPGSSGLGLSFLVQAVTPVETRITKISITGSLLLSDFISVIFKQQLNDNSQEIMRSRQSQGNRKQGRIR